MKVSRPSLACGLEQKNGKQKQRYFCEGYGKRSETVQTIKAKITHKHKHFGCSHD